jgi:hypothetical protein
LENSSEMEICLYFIENIFQYSVLLHSDWLIVFQKTDAGADKGQTNCLPRSHLGLDPLRERAQRVKIKKWTEKSNLQSV